MRLIDEAITALHNWKTLLDTRDAGRPRQENIQQWEIQTRGASFDAELFPVLPADEPPSEGPNEGEGTPTPTTYETITALNGDTPETLQVVMEENDWVAI